jgi:flavoprotein
MNQYKKVVVFQKYLVSEAHFRASGPLTGRFLLGKYCLLRNEGVASSYTMPSAPLSFQIPDSLAGRRVSIGIVASSSTTFSSKLHLQ